MDEYRTVLNEYRVVIPIAGTLAENISGVRKILHEELRLKVPFEINPGLTILRFHAMEQAEAKVLERIQNVVMTTAPFLVELEDFAAYPSHTIYINIKTRSPFNELCKIMKRAKKYFSVPGHEPHFINEPHLIIAQRLQSNHFSLMWKKCEHNQFSGKYIADHVLIYKRTESRRKYEVLRKMEFQSLPMNLKQGALFS